MARHANETSPKNSGCTFSISEISPASHDFDGFSPLSFTIQEEVQELGAAKLPTKQESTMPTPDRNTQAELENDLPFIDNSQDVSELAKDRAAEILNGCSLGTSLESGFIVEEMIINDQTLRGLLIDSIDTHRIKVAVDHKPLHEVRAMAISMEKIIARFEALALEHAEMEIENA